MGDILFYIGAFLFVWIFVSVLNKKWGNKDYSSGHDSLDLEDRLDEDDFEDHFSEETSETEPTDLDDDDK
ncbi:hypothetical protein LCL95_04365 [Bacillus timonensis]|nr:hypothetical protein [Bacillus timonensis]